MGKRFFTTVLSAMGLCLLLCVIQLVNIECKYEVLNFIESRNIVSLSPRQVTRQYIIALRNRDYKIAYDYLTPESREKFSFADFVVMNERIKTEMNENKTWVWYEEVRVGIQLYQDPASHSYVFVKTNGKWRLVMKSGTPTFPFAVDDGWCPLEDK